MSVFIVHGYMVNSYQLGKPESGISMIELAIVLPLLMLLVSGMVDMGFAINRVKSVVSASRQAARVAASHSKPITTAAQVACGESIEANCAQLAPLNGAASVTQIAAAAACNYIESNSGPASKWAVSVPQPIRSVENGTQFRSTVVSLRYTGKPCFICFHKLFGNFTPESTSSLVLEGTCY